MNVSKNVVKMLVAAGALAAATGAMAQSKGQFAMSVGVNQLVPKVESGAISAPALPNSLGDVGKDTQPVLLVNYGLTDNISVETALGTPYKHKLYGAAPSRAPVSWVPSRHCRRSPWCNIVSSRRIRLSAPTSAWVSPAPCL